MTTRNQFSAGKSLADSASGLSIIIVAYNSSTITRHCINSIIASDLDTELEIIVVNNSVADTGCAGLESVDPRVVVIANDHNVGFGAACNVGLKASRGRMILFLNPDVVLKSDTLSGMLQFMYNRPQCGLACCRVVDELGNLQRYSLSQAPSLSRAISDLHFFYKVPGLNRLLPGTAYPVRLFEKEFAPEVVAGAFMLFRRSVLDELGGFDERFFLYAEDVDLSVRAAAVASVCYCPDYQCQHTGHSTLGHGFGQEKFTYLYRSRVQYFCKHLGRASARSYVINLLFCGAIQGIPGAAMALCGRPFLLRRAMFFVRFAGDQIFSAVTLRLRRHSVVD